MADSMELLEEPVIMGRKNPRRPLREPQAEHVNSKYPREAQNMTFDLKNQHMT